MDNPLDESCVKRGENIYIEVFEDVPLPFNQFLLL
jgi:hypothetical protein